MNSKVGIPISVIISVIVTAGIIYSIEFQEQETIEPIETPNTPEIVYVDRSASDFFEGTQEIKKISSQDELIKVIDASKSVGNNFYENRIFAMPAVAMDDSIMFEFSESAGEPTSMPLGANVKDTSSNIDSPDYSTTNVQVANVDEPDFMKNDSKYVYIVSRNTLSIIEAYPAQDAKLVLKLH